MTRLLLLATLLATGASAQTPALAALVGTWEVTRDTTGTFAGPNGEQIGFTQFYSALDLSETRLALLTVSTQAGRPGPDAYQVRFPVRADGLTLHITDSTRAELQPVGERLLVRWMRGETVTGEMLMDRAPPPAVPDVLRGDWQAFVTDDAGVGMGLAVRAEANRMSFSAEVRPARFADGFVILSRDESFQDAEPVQSYRVFAIRKDGQAVVLAGQDETLRLVRR